MKQLLIKQIRDFKATIFLNISVFLITFAGIFLFSGLNSVGRSISTGINDFYSEQILADYTVTQKITGDQLDAVRSELYADGAVSLDAVTLKVGKVNRNINVSLFPYSEFKVNIPNIVKGEVPKESFEAIVDVAFAEANGIEPGNHLKVGIKGESYDILVTALAQFPDHLYKGDSIPRLAETGILKVFVPLKTLADLSLEIDTLYVSSELTEKDLRAKLTSLTGTSFNVARVLTRSENVSVVRVRTDIDLITSLMSILPAICFIALCLTLYVNMSKRMEDESYNIGVMSANGISKHKLVLAYILPYFVWVMIGGIIGAIMGTVILPPAYVSVLTRFYTLPKLGSSGIFISIILPLTILAAVTAFSLIIAILGIMKATPTELMRGKTRSSVKVLSKSKLSIVGKLSIRNFLSYKKKSFFTIVSAALCLSLLLTSFLLDNSVTNLQNTVYDKYYNYDTTFEWNLGDNLKYEDICESVTQSGLFDGIMYCFEFPSVYGESHQTIMVSIIDGSNPCYNLYDNGKKVTFGDDGVYVPSSYGSVDRIDLTIFAEQPFILELPVAGTYKDMGLFGVIVPIETLKKGNLRYFYNYLMSSDIITSVYTNKRDNVSEEEVLSFVNDLEEEYEAAFLYESHSVDSERFKQLFIVLDITEILLFLVCGIIMILLILNISCLSIADRIKDYTIFNAMGIGAKKINVLNSLENYISMIIAFILALPLGTLIAANIIKVIKQLTGVAVYLHLYVWSIVILFLGGALFTALSNIFINKKISKANIAYSLKIKE